MGAVTNSNKTWHVLVCVMSHNNKALSGLCRTSSPLDNMAAGCFHWLKYLMMVGFSWEIFADFEPLSLIFFDC